MKKSKKPKDFKITGEKGVKIISEDFLDAETESELINIFYEDIDFNNGRRLSLEFSRPGKLTYKDCLELLFNESAKDSIKKIMFLVDRLKKAL